MFIGFNKISHENIEVSEQLLGRGRAECISAGIISMRWSRLGGPGEIGLSLFFD